MILFVNIRLDYKASIAPIHAGRTFFLQIGQYLFKILDIFFASGFLMFQSSKPLFFLSFAILTLLMSPAFAGTEIQGVVQNMNLLSQQENADREQNTKDIIDGIQQSTETLAKAIAATSQDDDAPRSDVHFQSTLSGLPNALLLTDTTVRDVMANRLAELNLMAPPANKAAYLVDPTQTNKSLNAEMFDIFMRYFCDPKSRGGTMKNVAIKSARYPNMTLGCGTVGLLSGGSSAGTPSRVGILGPEPSQNLFEITDPATYLLKSQHVDVESLSQKADKLLFDPITFPIKPLGQGESNTNKLAEVYYGAFAQALQFLVGVTGKPGLENLDDPAGRATYMQHQAQIARKMLASYPFALLFSERVGTLGPNVAQATANMLLEKIGGLNPNDDGLFNKLQNLKRRKSLSLAEYKYAVMYEVLMSPGYVSRINQMKPVDVEIEKVRLGGLLVAQKYEINRWMELLVALEAIK